VVPLPHRDYAGGAAEARRRWPDAEFIGAGQPLPCVAGQSWTRDQVTFVWLHPNASLPELGRDSGCVLEIRSAAGSVLLTGGISRNVARRMRLTERAAPVDVLLLPAMGHRDALDPAWLETLSPRLAIATVAIPNRRGLPHAEIVAPLQRLNTPLLTTGDCGALRIRFGSGRAPEVIAERVERPRFWRRAEGCADVVARLRD
ncbi:MAG: ComEC/Rec2 family competence protein, partial [Wenzhouxiangellaceae bacterium]